MSSGTRPTVRAPLHLEQRVAYSVRDLVKRYGAVTANDGLSLDIAAGETVGIFGPNGAGKTTLVRQLAGLTAPTSGDITLFGHDLTRDPDAAARLVAMQPQDAISLWNLRVVEALTYTGRLRGLGWRRARAACDEFLDAFELGDRRKHLVKTLSGGERRLLTVATTLIGERAVLVFDEPTNDLDIAMRRTVWGLVQRRRDGGTTIVVVTHNLHEVEQLIDRAIIMHAGRVVKEGPVAGLARALGRRRRIRLRGVTADGLPRLAVAHTVDAIGPDLLLHVHDRDVGELVRQLAEHWGGDEVPDFSVEHPSLEEVYLDVRERRS